jgi:hypothetical protein
MNRRLVALIALASGLVLVAAGYAGTQGAGRSLQSRLIAPGASDVQVRSAGLGEQRISYHAPGAAYGWFFTATRNLAADGWTPPVDTRSRIRTAPVVYWRITRLWFVYISERVALQGEPNDARISIRREIIIPQRLWP